MNASEDSASLAGLILEQIADAVIFADARGNIVLWNPAAAALFGYSAAEAVGQSLNLIIPEHLQPAHWRGFEAAISSGVMRLQGRATLTRARHKSGRRLYVEMTFALVGAAAGAARGAVAVARDVTERVGQQRGAARTEGGPTPG